MSLTEHFPEYGEAVRREQDQRDLAFCGTSVPICGIPCKLITPRIYSLLRNCDNAFVTGGRPKFDDIALFLWFCYEHFENTPRARSLFIRHHVAKIDPQKAFDEICAFIEMNFSDAPCGGKREAKAYTSHIAAIVDSLASTYGWRDEWILDMPLMRIYQYYRRIQLSQKPDGIMFNRSDSVLSEALRKRNAEAQKN